MRLQRRPLGVREVRRVSLAPHGSWAIHRRFFQTISLGTWANKAPPNLSGADLEATNLKDANANGAVLTGVTLGEEVGWRGYALPALQVRYGALLASLILGVLWGLWHLPVFFNPDTSYSRLPFLLFLVFIVPVAVLMTWLFNSTGGSVLMAMLFHAVLNTADELWKVLPEYSVEPPTAAEAAAASAHYYLMVAIVLWVAAIVLVLVYGPRDLSRHPRQVLAAASSESQPRVR
jgi:membrane protease YdiL (CAAX protease family)